MSSLQIYMSWSYATQWITSAITITSRFHAFAQSKSKLYPPKLCSLSPPWLTWHRNWGTLDFIVRLLFLTNLYFTNMLFCGLDKGYWLYFCEHRLVPGFHKVSEELCKRVVSSDAQMGKQRKLCCWWHVPCGRELMVVWTDNKYTHTAKQGRFLKDGDALRTQGMLKNCS